MMRSLYALIVLILAPAARSNPISCMYDDDPTGSAASIQPYNTTEPILQTNILSARASPDILDSRQASCPNPGTNGLCKSNFCFIYQQSNDGTAWATCCPAGWSLQLNSADWSTQKCVLGSTSEAPLRPLSCGGSINGQPGTISSWACVYSNQNVNGGGRFVQSHLLVAMLALAWLDSWLS